MANKITEIDETARITIEAIINTGKLARIARENNGYSRQIADALVKDGIRLNYLQIDSYFRKKGYNGVNGWYIEEVNARDCSRS